MNIPSNEYMKKVKKLARDGKIRTKCCKRYSPRVGCLLHIYMYANERRESTNPIVMARYNFLFFSSLVLHAAMLYVQPTINNIIISSNFIF